MDWTYRRGVHAVAGASVADAATTGLGLVLTGGTLVEGNPVVESLQARVYGAIIGSWVVDVGQLVGWGDYWALAAVVAMLAKLAITAGALGVVWAARSSLDNRLGRAWLAGVAAVTGGVAASNVAVLLTP
jgi:hypothetical protein